MMEKLQPKPINNNPILPEAPKKEIVKVEDQKAERTFGEFAKDCLIKQPVKFLAPGAMAVGGGAIGMLVGGIPGAILGGAIGVKVGLKTDDKIGDLAVVAFDKVVDVASDAVVFVAKKAVEGVTYLGKMIYEKIKGAFDKAINKEEEVDLLENVSEEEMNELEKEFDEIEVPTNFDDLQNRLDALKFPKVPTHGNK